MDDNAAPAGTDALLDIEEAASLLGTTAAAVMARIDAGELTAIRLPSAQGKARRYRVKFGDLLDAYADDLLTPDEIAAALKVSRRYVYYLIQDGYLKTIQLPSRRTGKPWGHRVPRARFAAFIGRLEEEAGLTA